jgi:hypothetical protein
MPPKKQGRPTKYHFTAEEMTNRTTGIPTCPHEVERLYGRLCAIADAADETRHDKVGIVEAVRNDCTRKKVPNQEWTVLHEHLIDKRAVTVAELERLRVPVAAAKLQAKLTRMQKATFLNQYKKEKDPAKLTQWMLAYKSAVADIQYMLKKAEIYDADDAERDNLIREALGTFVVDEENEKLNSQQIDEEEIELMDAEILIVPKAQGILAAAPAAPVFDAMALDDADIFDAMD